MLGATVVMIGNFDGVHIGHAALAALARQSAGPGGRVVALVFHPHPLALLNPDEAPLELTTFDQRQRLLRSLGIDEVVQLRPTKALLGLAPRSFLEKVVEDWNPRCIVEGVDFRFGRGRVGDVRALEELGRELGFSVDVVGAVEAALTDGSTVRASSTLARWLVTHGRVGDAARVLGRPYELAGIVVRGDRRGRLLGFPTANLDTPNLIPGDGVYAGAAVLPDGSRHAAAIHIGVRSTFDDQRRTVEAFIVDWAGPGADSPEYGWTLRLEVSAFLRDQKRFEGADDLVEQIERDVRRVRDLSGEATPLSRARGLHGAIA